MATVYLAQDLKHDRKVAVKLLREELSASLGKDRFLREIKVAAALQHPHILPLYDSGEADGLLFYVMPYVDGLSLRDKLQKEGELPIGDAVRILRDIADALTEAHRHGVVHRDLKPENVMLRGRHALVMDFGVAKALSEATGRQSLTTIGVALGTPTYMAPEQAVADPHVDHRADLYAFGVVAYELLAGRPPFTGTTPQQILAAHVTAAAEPVATHRAMPPALAALVMRCLEKRPADRWQSAEELITQLESVLTPSGGITPTATVPVTAVPPPRSRRALAAFAVAAILLVAGVAAWQVTHRQSGESPGTPSSVIAKRVGVLPFESRSRDTSDAYLGDGMATDLTTTLAGMTGLHVVSRSSSFALRGKTAHEAGAALTADAMVEGTVGKVELWRTALSLLPLWALALARRPGLGLALAIPSLLASAAVGHSAAIQPLWAVPLKAIHLAALAVWFGGLIWLIVRERGDAHTTATDVARVSTLALWAVVAVTVSGIAQTLILVQSTAGVRSPYGGVVIAKILGLAVLVGFGAYHRRRFVPAIASRGEAVAGALRTSVARELSVFCIVILLGGFLAYLSPPTRGAVNAGSHSSEHVP